MSFGLPAVKVKPEIDGEFNIRNGSFGVPNLMVDGLTKLSVEDRHPIICSELNHADNKHKMNMAILKNTQGFHAPLRISMEIQSAKKIGRLPFLPSSNIMLDVLTGRDIELGPEDIFNNPENFEYQCQPHAVMEKYLRLL